MQYLLVFLVAIAATFLQTSIGFGFAVFAMIFLPMVLPYGTAIAICQAIAILNTTYLAIRYYKYIQWKIMIPLLIPTLVLGIAFTLVSFSFETQYLKAMLGFVLLLLSLYFFRFSNSFHVQPTRKTGMAMGAISGVGNGLFGIGGPPAALYLLPAINEKLAYLATVQAYFTFNNITNLTTRILKGAFELSHIGLLIVGWLGVGLGTVLGLIAFKRVKTEIFKKLVYAFVGLNGAWIIIQELIIPFFQ
ncbi:MAG: sulfite exporter TauE/SafE family protein [Sphaerochaetaceae bacterium]|nr:sulfite exporter TauE/SafE family protein [uncultured Sphaerochaeta sp.]MDC7229628.1 sulfite exporter TauE/SafE family protein [Sphaerochaetaceae bacterium]